MNPQIGKTYTLKALSKGEKGFWLDAGDREVLLSNKWIPKSFQTGDEIEVFLFRDSEDRPAAIPLKPLAQLGECALMRITDLEPFGAFAEWGIPKDLLIPRSEQLRPLRIGESVLVKVLLDPDTERLIGTTRILDTLITDTSELRGSQEVDVFLISLVEMGWKAVVNHRFQGFFYNDDLPSGALPGKAYRAYIKNIRSDGKLDLSTRPLGFARVVPQSREQILQALKNAGGYLSLHDGSSPEEIQKLLGLSKKSFKAAIGTLYKEKIILLEKSGIRLI